MSVKFHCDRCGALGEPSADRVGTTSSYTSIVETRPSRTEMVNVPDRWVKVLVPLQLAPHISTGAIGTAEKTICTSCARQLERWMKEPPATARELGE